MTREPKPDSARVRPHNVKRLPMQRGRPTMNPIGVQVRLPYQGNVLLGDVVGCYYRESPPAFMLKVRHFDGTDWPIDPAYLAVEPLSREDASCNES